MSKIIGVTVGTTMSPQTIKDKLKPVLSVNDVKPDENGNLTLEITNGKDGYTPVKGVDYFDGKDGYTPIKGVDYFTEKDKEEMVTMVVAALPVYDGEVVTE